jgi:formylglycine-generating enzyme required for sulfatase activity
MTSQEFAAKWRDVGVKERVSAQEHFIDLCRMLGHPTLVEADPAGEVFPGAVYLERQATYDPMVPWSHDSEGACPMAEQLRVFVSHAGEDTAIAEQLARDLRAEGADVWLDATHLGPGDFVARISRAMEQRDVLVLVLSPAAVHSQWVPDEMNAAIVRSKQGLMHPPVIVVVRTVPVENIPALWTIYNRIDCSRSYDEGLQLLYRSLQLSSGQPPKPRRVAPQRKGIYSSPRLSRRQVLIGSGVAAGVVAIGGAAWLARPGQGTGSPVVFPDRLASLGFALRTKGNTKYIVPPLSDVPAGEFLMGSDPAKDAQAFDNEKPQGSMTLGAFQIAKHPLTVAEYAAFMQQGGYSAPGHWTNQQQKPDHPVVNVSWLDAQAYAVWLAQATGESWRLPTEAEREKAARGTDGRLYPWGNTFDMTRCNSSMSVGTTTPVGTHPSGASPYGVQDMAGNVWEWTSSQFIPYPYNASDGREDPNSSGDRVDRGGSWYSLPRYVRAACRYGNPPNYVGSDIGFRLILSAPGSS